MIYSDQPEETVMAAIPNRTWKSLCQHAAQLKLKRTIKTKAPRRPWTAEEDAKLKQVYVTGTTLEDLARQLGRTLPAVATRARDQRLVRPESFRLKDVVVEKPSPLSLQASSSGEAAPEPVRSAK